MNIALSAIILILILLPGTTAISAYYGSLTNKASGVNLPFNELLAKGLIISVTAHGILLLFLQIIGYKAQLIELYNVVSGERSQVTEHYPYPFVPSI